ncbi:ABC transporter substrate-binding protein [Paenibacillus agaridevorans]|uniref:ABC transporter substrate-binding protein n=1 Tax=Paenibacillus agaridevorans TaxID=171404 RepID=UPI001BE4890A|nr:ABC transporter substrate-binding protein [Paenibacillus agaridevorans]
MFTYRSLFKSVCSSVVLLTLLTSCQTGPNESEQTKLKILSVYDQATIHNMGLRSFLNEHPDITVEFLDMSDNEGNVLDKYGRMETLMTDQKPDIVINDALSYRLLAEQNRFLDLKPMSNSDDDWSAGRYGAIDQWMALNGNGTLGGLAPVFDSMVVLYNADLFHTYGVSIPGDGLTWNQLLNTAKLFSIAGDGENPIHGYYTDQLEVQFIDQMAATHNLSYMDWDRKVATADSPSWKTIYETVIQALQSGGLGISKAAPAERTIADAAELFAQGRIAMMQANYGTVKKLEGMETSFAWGALTQPVEESNRGAGNMTPSFIYSIHGESRYVDQAKELLLAMNNKESALKHSAANGLLPAWQSGQAGAESNLAPFYSLEAKFVRQDRFWEIPLDLLLQIRQIRSDNFQSALSGDITVEEALRKTQESLQSLLDSAISQ